MPLTESFRKSYAVIGYPLGHTLSPFVHRRLFDLTGSGAPYEAIEIAPGGLEPALPRLSALGGFNITMPYKFDIIPYLDAVDEVAARLQSVNTVCCGQKLVGYNTDAFGFSKSLENLGRFQGAKVCILGAGSTAGMAASECAAIGCEITIAHRRQSAQKAQALCAKVQKYQPQARLTSVCEEALSGDFALLVNATPVGMLPNTEDCPAADRLLAHCANVFDVVYNPPETLLIKKARANGSNVLSGLVMLVWQAVKAHQIWRLAQFEENQIDAVIADSAAYLAKLAQP